LQTIMLGRGRINGPDRGGSVLSHAAGALEERLVWGGGERLRAVGDALRWPLERIGWAIERRLLWPIEEHTASWRMPGRTIGLMLLGVLAVAAGVLALLLTIPGQDSANRALPPVAGSPAPAPLPVQPAPAPEPKAPVLHGAAPHFPSAPAQPAKESGASHADSAAGGAATSSSTATAAKTSAPAALPAAAPAGPAALKVAREFAAAFVAYETGDTGSDVRAGFKATSTPRLAHELLRRPPRQPAGVKVPKAKVLNVVAAPSDGRVYPVSVSLLRLNVTSELRLEMERVKKDWRVSKVLG
jgi:hypothetical protein